MESHPVKELRRSTVISWKSLILNIRGKTKLVSESQCSHWFSHTAFFNILLSVILPIILVVVPPETCIVVGGTFPPLSSTLWLWISSTCRKKIGCHRCFGNLPNSKKLAGLSQVTVVLPKFSLELLWRTGTGQTKRQSLVLSGSGSVGSGTCSVLNSGIWLSSQNRFELSSNRTFLLIMLRLRTIQTLQLWL